MSDLLQAGLWAVVLLAGLGGAIVLRRLGLATTYVRDLLHVGAGVWVLGWPYWHAGTLPALLVGGAFAMTLIVPRVADRVPVAAKMRDAVSDGDERWVGLERYTLAYLVLTVVGVAGGDARAAVAAAAGLWALALGDGLGGAIGRRFGRHFFAAPGGKRKSFEGSVAVGVAASLGAWAAGAWLGAPLGAELVLAAGLVAALAEALAPAATDNLVVPAAVWVVLMAAPFLQ